MTSVLNFQSCHHCHRLHISFFIFQMWGQITGILSTAPQTFSNGDFIGEIFSNSCNYEMILLRAFFPFNHNNHTNRLYYHLLYSSNWKLILPFSVVILLFSATFITKNGITFAVNICVFPSKKSFFLQRMRERRVA